MNKEVKTKWLEALRSGKYKQGQGCLAFNGKFCCLGVLCDISGVGKWDNDGSYVCPDGSRSSQVPPMEVVVCAELGCENPMMTPSNETLGRLSLGRLNDNRATFDKIANLIEEQL